ncbi:MAG TPA: ATP-dependent DNA helicase RecG [Acidimicrobiales bacterium]|nr:ATP-dependent DNA helicase RecG [Acidimicrobiales bacterium]
MARRLSRLAELDVGELKGVGSKRAAMSKVGIDTVLDLITHYPRRYIDRSRQVEIASLAPADEALVVAKVRSSSLRRARTGKMLVEVVVGDDSGRMKVTFFNQAWRAKQLREGTEAAFFGKVELFRGSRQMTNPVVDLVGNRTGRIIPLYPQSEKEGLTTWDKAGWVEEALERAGVLLDPLPDEWRERLELIGRDKAFHDIHTPATMEDTRPAHRRLAFDELFRLQMTLVLRKRALERESKGIRHVVEGDLVPRFHAALPFQLTGDQRKAIDEIAADLAGPHPMHRLLQGEVGSGKTVVAATALLVGVQGGHQGALMAPTEVLAEQHYLGLRELFRDLSVPDPTTLMGDRPLVVELLTNRTGAADRARLHAGLVDGKVDLLIGTHALLTEGVEFASLGVIVIDEQHRFGVEQRAALRGKGDDPDVLVMTATPIPRTAAMTVYGDLDVTVIREMPPGRRPPKTVWLPGPLEEETAWKKVRDEVATGSQAYVVCPLVEESEKIQARSAEEEFIRLKSDVFPGLRLDLLHGRMPAKDKEKVMAAFRAGQLDVLVATTVIEVGVDVPDASVMVIESADRFGIAQLHQLRGRVGRKGQASWCYLLSEETEGEASERLDALVKNSDGFELAEIDLELRGEGTILGVRQKGRTDLKLASLRRDRDLVARAREVAFAIVDSDPLLAGHPDLAEEIRSLVEPDEAEFLFKS